MDVSECIYTSTICFSLVRTWRLKRSQAPIEKLIHTQIIICTTYAPSNNAHTQLSIHISYEYMYNQTYNIYKRTSRVDTSAERPQLIKFRLFTNKNT